MAARSTVVAASLFAIIFFCAFGAFAANSGVVYQATFNPNSPVLGSIRIHLQNDSISPLMIYAVDTSGILRSVPFQFSHKDIVFDTQPNSVRLSGISISYRAHNNSNSINRSTVYANNTAVAGDWGLPHPLTNVGLTDVVDVLSIGQAGAVDTHTVSFYVNTFPIADSGAVWVNFPEGFDISNIDSVIYSDSDTTNDGLDQRPTIDSIAVINRSVVFRFTPSKQQASASSRISLKFWPVGNDTVAQEYSVLVMTTNRDGEIENDLVGSSPFTLTPGPLSRIALRPDTAMTLQAGSLVDFSASGWDRYNNPLSELDFTFDVTIDSCGDITGGAFRTHKVGSTRVTVSSDGVADTSGLLTIVPGPLGRFDASGFPPNVIAGTPFQNDIVVQAVDIEGNRKSDYLGYLWFVTSDTIADLPNRVGNPYHFTAGNAGQAAFAGSGFALKSVGTGISTILVTNGTIGVNSPPIRVNPGLINTFIMATTPSHTAGVSFLVNVSNAKDLYGNYAAGDIVVSDSIGAGNSPNGTAPAFNHIVVNGGTGSALQTLVKTGTGIILKGISSSNVRGTAGPFEVLPGITGGFTLAGYPDTVSAGGIFVPPVRVHVNDIFGNAKTNYTGSVYFTSSDPQAMLPYSLTSPCSLIGSDSTFAGDRFSLRTAGRQDIEITDGTFSTTSNIITVLPAFITQFNLTAPANVTAGSPFAVSVSGAQDIWGNAANGTVSIATISGGGPSPDGTQPTISPIAVINGSGNALQTLFNVNSTVLRGTCDGVQAQTDPIAVAPGVLGGFNFNIHSPQVVGVPFRTQATLTTLDRYGNWKTDFNAASDSIVITSTAGGRMTNNILKLQTDFIQGVADLVTKGITYRGLGGLMSFQSTSSTNISGLSNQVDMNAIRCVSFNIDQANVAQGDTVTGSISINNAAGRSVSLTGLSVIDGASWIPQPIPDSTLPVSIGAGATVVFGFTLPIPDTLFAGSHRLTGAALGAFGLDVVADTLPGFPDSIRVQARSTLGYTAGSLHPDTLSSGSTYSLSLRMTNNGSSAVALFDSSYLTFTDNVNHFRTDLSAPAYLAPGNPVLLTFESTMVPAGFISGNYTATFHYFGNENGNFRSGQVTISDQIVVQGASSLSYNEKLNISYIAAGQTVAFAFEVLNNGQADFIVSHQNTRFSFSDSQREYVAFSDTTSGNRTDTLHQGGTIFQFAPTQLSPNFTPGKYLARATFSGRQNGQDTSFTFRLGTDSISVLAPAKVRIDSTYAMSRNAPFVNTSQPCSLRVLVENLGDEGAVTVYLHLASTGNSEFPDSLLVASLGGHQILPVIFSTMPASMPNSNEIFSSSLSGGMGALTGNPAQIAPPLDNNALLITETPAELKLSPITIIGPPGALDSTISIAQNVTVSISVQNLGQAELSGAQTLSISSDALVPDSLQRGYVLGQPVHWQLTAPNTAIDSAGFSISISGNPIDMNDGSSAVGQYSTSTLAFAVENRASIEHHASITNPEGARDGVVSTDQIFIITEILEPFGLFRTKAVRLNLPDNFTTQDSLVKYPLGDTVIWHLRAPAYTALDTAEIACWIYDLNLGDSSEASNIQSIPITVVDAARLQLSANILGPPSALDGIVEPGAQLEFQAIVRNLGQAGVGVGRLKLQTGRTDMIVAENSIRDFTADTPLIWTINVPNEEISLPIPIWVAIDSTPVEENTNLPARISSDSAAVTVVVRELYPKLVLSNITGYAGSAVKGQSLAYVSFDLQNRDFGGNFQIGLTGLKFNLQSTPQVSASEIFSSVTLVTGSRTLTASDLSGSVITFSTTDTIFLQPAAGAHITLDLELSQDVSIRDFSIGFGNDLVQASVIENGIATEQLNAISAHGEEVGWQGNPTMILEPNFTASISSYPNPFSPQTGGTKIGYYLPQACDLDIKIFTLLGELVWSKTVSSSEQFGAAGLHSGASALTWNGVNDLGREIRSGVYICIVKNITTGEEAKFKIAVVK